MAEQGYIGTESESTSISLRESLAYIPDGSTIPDESWRSRHKWFVITVLSHIPFLWALGFLDGTESALTGAELPELSMGMVFLETGIIAAFALAATVSQLSRRTRTVLAVTGLAFCSGTLVHVTGGYIEAHFHFFIAIGVAAIYEDWLPFGIGIGYVVITHGVFGVIDPSRVYNHTAAQLNPWAWGVIHGIGVALLAGALTIHLISIEKSREQSQQRLTQVKERATEIDNLEQRRREIEEEKEEAQRLKTEAEQQRAEVAELNDHLQEKAAAYRNAMMTAADGDLTVRVDPVSESDAMTDIGEAFNEMVSENEAVMAEIQDFAHTVQARTEEADTGVQEATQASTSMSESVQGIVEGTKKQQESLGTISGEMTNLSAAVEEVAASAESVAQASGETTQIVRDSQALAEDMIDDARAVETSIDATVETVEELETQMSEIAEITDLISDIAEQTNMLALNANIEAARAGNGENGTDAGEGFGVVANEVKQLAEESRSSAGDIQSRIEKTQSQTATTVAQVEEARELIQQEIKAVEEVVDAFAEIADNAERTDDGIQEISATTDDQAATSEEVVSMADDVTQVSNESAKEAQNASTSAEELAASMNQVEDSIDSVATRSIKLKDRVESFTTN